MESVEIFTLGLIGFIIVSALAIENSRLKRIYIMKWLAYDQSHVSVYNTAQDYEIYVRSRTFDADDANPNYEGYNGVKVE
jgi:hypothetical protein